MAKPANPKEYLTSIRSEIKRLESYYSSRGPEESSTGNISYWTVAHTMRRSFYELTRMLGEIEKEMQQGKSIDPESALVEKINACDEKKTANLGITKNELLQAKYLASMIFPSE